MAFDDLNEKPREFVIAILEELEGGDYAVKAEFRAVHQMLKHRWSLIADGKPLELPTALDRTILAELENFEYILDLNPSGAPHIKDYSITRKAYIDYRSDLAPEVKMEGLAQRPDFSFVNRTDLRSIIERDYEEIQACLGSEAHKAATVMCGSVMEALLLDRLLGDEAKARQAARGLRSKIGKVNKDLRRWNLNQMIEVAVGLGIVPDLSARMTDALREYRNLIHPAVEIRKQTAPGREEATLARSALDLIIKNLGQTP